MEKKKDRAVNFTAREVEVLCDLVVKFKSVLECKKTDAVTWKLKDEYWNKLTTIFNSRTLGPPRTVKSLKTKYDAFKKDLRKKMAKNKLELNKTGGGTFKELPLTPCEESIYEVIGFSIEGLPSEMDSDCVQKSLNIIQVPMENESEYEKRMIVNEGDESVCSFKVVEPIEEFADLYTPPKTQNEKEELDMHLKSTSTLLKTPVSKNLQANKKKNIETKLQAAEKVSLLSSAKKQLIDVQIKYYQAEFEFKGEENQLKLRKAEAELKKEEIDVEIKLLEKKIREETLKKLLQNTFSI